MIKRYEDPEITELWSNENKLQLWQRTELAVMYAMVILKRMPKKIFVMIKEALLNNPIDIAWWLARDKDIKHDLNAFLDERLRFLTPDQQQYFHKKITSYDTEESAFVTTLKNSCDLVWEKIIKIEIVLFSLSQTYRFTIMNARTHGQEAEMQSFGKRCLTWLADLRQSKKNLLRTMSNLEYSKISGAIGNYGSIDLELEKIALAEMKLKPYYGSTQIMPREIHAPIAQALCQVVMTLNKIALAIRLGARSGRPIFEEPFAKKQKGSSAMPHKKNTIMTEQIEGMARLAQGYAQMIQQNIITWEERAIEQSSVERVAWPDLFHVVSRSLTVMKNVLAGLNVYCDNMLTEIVESRGCYASSEAKELLKEFCQPHGTDNETAYRIVQLAAFNAFEPSDKRKTFRHIRPNSLSDTSKVIKKFKKLEPEPIISIEDIIKNGQLRTSEKLEASKEQVAQWNKMLVKIFEKKKNVRRWREIFKPSFQLRNENALYQEIIGA